VRARAFAVCACALLGPSGCASDPDPVTTAPGAVVPADTGFIAFTRDFDGFRSWPHVDVYPDAGPGDPAHVESHLVEYINAPPPAGATEFPVKTIIIKEGLSAAGSRLFAMVKRGGGYNGGGARGWEWFELSEPSGPGSPPLILWRGTTPPITETYGGNVNADCNACHVKAARDAVFVDPL